MKFPAVLMCNLFLLLFFSASHLGAWDALTLDESRKRVMTKLSEIGKKYAKEDSELSKQALKVAENDSKAKKNTAWMEPTMSFIKYSLEMYPAQKGNAPIRKDLLWVLDALLNVDNSGAATPLTQTEQKIYADVVNQYRNDCWERLVKEVASTKVPAGSMAVWKVNNMGIIAKTKSHTFGFDLYMPQVPGGEVKRDKKLDDKFAKLLDVMFISHSHGDHMEYNIMQTMQKLKKPVYVAWDEAKKGGFTKLWGTDGKFIPVKGMEVMSIPGIQSRLNNSITIVRADGVTIAHEGDNTLVPAYEKLADAGKIDIVIGQVHFYYERLTRKARELANNSPKELFFFTGHEEELGHRVNIRMPFYHFSNPTMADMPCFVTTYGEGVFFPSGKAVRPSPRDKSSSRSSFPAKKPVLKGK